MLRVDLRKGTERVGRLPDFRPDANTKHYLSKAVYRFLPMTACQQMLVNRAVYRGQDPGRYLSPRQRQIPAYIRSHSGLE